MTHSRCLKRHSVSIVMMNTTPWTDAEGDELMHDSFEINDSLGESQANRIDGMFLSIIGSAN